MRIASAVLRLAIASIVALTGAAVSATAADAKTVEQPAEPPHGALLAQLQAADRILAPLAEVAKAIGAINDGGDQRAAVKQALAAVSQVQNQLPGLKAAFAEAERTVGPNGGEAAVASLEKHLAELKRKLRAAGGLDGEDKLDDFEIQELMSAYNQAEQLATNVLKKRDDTQNSLIGKV